MSESVLTMVSGFPLDQWANIAKFLQTDSVHADRCFRRPGFNPAQLFLSIEKDMGALACCCTAFQRRFARKEAAETLFEAAKKEYARELMRGWDPVGIAEDADKLNMFFDYEMSQSQVEAIVKWEILWLTRYFMKAMLSTKTQVSVYHALKFANEFMQKIRVSTNANIPVRILQRALRDTLPDATFSSTSADLAAKVEEKADQTFLCLNEEVRRIFMNEVLMLVPLRLDGCFHLRRSYTSEEFTRWAFTFPTTEDAEAELTAEDWARVGTVVNLDDLATDED